MSGDTAQTGEEGVAHVKLRDVSMSFGGRQVFENLSADVPRGSITVVLGGSGMGKSTILRLVGGLIRPDAGSIEVDGEEITHLSESRLYRVRRKLGMMFQGGALLDATNVFDNLAFPLREHSKRGPGDVNADVHQALLRVGLVDVDDLLPSELSGGMIKRVALARAIMMNPVILLCDEPFSGLDPITAKRVEILLQRINRDLGITMLVVSHDPASTLRMADHALVLLPDGCVQGPPAELAASADPRVSNLLSVDVDESVVLFDDLIERFSAQAMRGGRADSTWS